MITEQYEDEMDARHQKHLQHLDNALREHYPKAAYTKDELGHLRDYTNGSVINSELWDFHHKEKTPPERTEWSDIRGTDHALNKIKTPRSFHVYSNTKMDPRKEKDSDGIVHHPAYMSTSINKQFPKHWHNTKFIEDGDGGGSYEKHILKIRVPKDHTGSYVGQHISSVPGQHEFILPRATDLKYIGTHTEKVSHKNSFGTIHMTYHTHHMEIV
jgi:hypothetical protein